MDDEYDDSDEAYIPPKNVGKSVLQKKINITNNNNNNNNNNINTQKNTEINEQNEQEIIKEKKENIKQNSNHIYKVMLRFC